MTAVVPTDQRIRRAALRLLEKEGHGAVTMRSLARSIGITPMAIYHHFATREALLKAAVDKEFGEFLQMWAHVHGYIALYRAGRFSLSPSDFKQLVHRSMRRLFRGLGVRDAHGRKG
jgi:AcrR family transcriptional regulator